MFNVSKSNKINGNGFMIWYDSFEKYVGQWIDCLQNGKGIQIWYESKGEFKFLRNRYIGEWRHGQRHGYGVFLYSNGSKYEGMWENNSKNGFGIFTNQDGTQTVGFYKYDRFVEAVQLNVVRTEKRKNTKNRSITPVSNSEEKERTLREVNSSAVRSTNMSMSQHDMPKKPGNLDVIHESDELNHTGVNGKGRDKDTTNENIVINVSQSNPVIDISSTSLQMKNNASSVNNHQKIPPKESEFNPYHILIDISDMIEVDPDIETNLKEIENILLRYNSDIRLWYKMYANKEYLKDHVKDDQSHSSKMESGKLLTYPDEKRTSVHLTPVISESIYNNDLGFAMEMRDLWRFLRDCNLINADFTLAMFDRLFYRGPRNYVEMFMLPEDLDQKFVYDYIYKMIQKSKDEFCQRFRDRVKTELDQSNASYVVGDMEVVFDIHNKRQIILLRQFSEAIIRIAFLKYYNYDQPLHIKLKMLIENNIKTNMLFKRVKKRDKSVLYSESSANSSHVLDIRVKSVDIDIEPFMNTYELELKAIFKELYSKSILNIKKNDTTMTYRYFYENIIKRCPQFIGFLEKHKYIELINIFHKEKMILSEDNKNSKEAFAYIEALMDSEMVFYEFGEVIFFIGKKYFQQNGTLEKNYLEIFKIIDDQSKKLEPIYEAKEKYYMMTLPKLKHHTTYEHILEAKRLKEEEEKRRAAEVRRYNMERKLLQLEDNNVVPEEKRDSEDEEEEDEDSDYE
jgi:hypothetical protein